jgi:hypothetical protein
MTETERKKDRKTGRKKDLISRVKKVKKERKTERQKDRETE